MSSSWSNIFISRLWVFCFLICSMKPFVLTIWKNAFYMRSSLLPAVSYHRNPKKLDWEWDELAMGGCCLGLHPQQVTWVWQLTNQTKIMASPCGFWWSSMVSSHWYVILAMSEFMHHRTLRSNHWFFLRRQQWNDVLLFLTWMMSILMYYQRNASTLNFLLLVCSSQMYNLAGTIYIYLHPSQQLWWLESLLYLILLIWHPTEDE